MCSEKCGITINGISNNERWRRERKKNRLSKRTEQNNTQREEITTKKMRKERSAFINPDCCCCSSYNWLMLLYSFYLFFSFFSIPGWFAIYSKDSCSTFQNDSNNTNRLDVDFVDFALTAVVVVFSKIRKKNLVSIVFPLRTWYYELRALFMILNFKRRISERFGK